MKPRNGKKYVKWNDDSITRKQRQDFINKLNSKGIQVVDLDD